MDISYLVTPFIAWVAAGAIKFIINSAKSKTFAFSQMGYGGLPSTHATVVTSTAALIAIREGSASPVFGVAVTLAFIVILDAHGLRRHIGKQARIINQLASQMNHAESLRERVGHDAVEIGAGILLGILLAYIVSVTL